jgi:hypothetical protein
MYIDGWDYNTKFCQSEPGGEEELNSVKICKKSGMKLPNFIEPLYP